MLRRILPHPVRTLSTIGGRACRVFSEFQLKIDVLRHRQHERANVYPGLAYLSLLRGIRRRLNTSVSFSGFRVFSGSNVGTTKSAEQTKFGICDRPVFVFLFV